jgi:peptidoglycan-associated lipoprotein
VKRENLILIILSIMLTSGCSKKEILPSGESESSYSGTAHSTSLNGDDEGITSEVVGGVTESGKYTGKDGVSAGGIKMIYFSSDRYDIESDQLRRLMQDMPKIKKLATIGKVRIEGNCDEFGTDEYNHALGLKRARAVKSVLISNGIPSNKISIVSYGESNPVCTGKSAPCHAKNRRAEINRI